MAQTGEHMYSPGTNVSKTGRAPGLLAADDQGLISLQSPYMPLLQSIVGEFDRELARLHALRSIVAGLTRTPALITRYVEPAVAAVAPSIEPTKPPRETGAVAGRPRERRTPKASVSVPGALAKVVPSGPVLVTSDQLAEQKSKREQGREELAAAAPAPPEDLDALSRSLAARWSTGPIQ